MSVWCIFFIASLRCSLAPCHNFLVYDVGKNVVVFAKRCQVVRIMCFGKRKAVSVVDLFSRVGTMGNSAFLTKFFIQYALGSDVDIAGRLLLGNRSRSNFSSI